MKNLLSFQLFYHIHQHDRNKILVKICFLPLGQVLRFIEKKLWNNYYISFSSHHPKLLLHFVIFKSYGTYFCQKSNKNYCLHDITKTVWTSHIQHQMFSKCSLSTTLIIDIRNFLFVEQSHGHTHCYLQRKDENTTTWDPETLQEEVMTLTFMHMNIHWTAETVGNMPTPYI